MRLVSSRVAFPGHGILPCARLGQGAKRADDPGRFLPIMRAKSSSSLRRGQKLAAAWKYHAAGSQKHDKHAIEKAAAKLMRKPDKAAEVLAKLDPEHRRAVALRWALTELEEEFVKADSNHDGKLTYAEFKAWALKTIETGPQRDEVTD